MGQSVAKLFDTNQENKIIVVGLDAGGKTTILHKIKLGTVTTIIPTIGFNLETIQYKGLNITCWDVGGSDKFYPPWRKYYANTNAIIYVVDSNDRVRIPEVRIELEKMLGEEDLREAILLVFANKQDLPNALNVNEITEGLGLKNLSRKWNIQPSCARNGDGLYEGFEWVAANLQNLNSSKPSYTTNATPASTSL